MKKEELEKSFQRVVIENELYDGETIIISKEQEGVFIDAIYTELINNEERRGRKRYYFNYIKKVMNEKDWYINKMTVYTFVDKYIHDESDFEDIKISLSNSTNWPMFWKYIIDIIFGIHETV